MAGGCIAFGPRAGQKVLTLQRVMPRQTKFNHTLCADMQGFSLHAAVRCDADSRQALEQQVSAEADRAALARVSG